jgi:hypothetical protein
VIMLYALPMVYDVEFRDVWTWCMVSMVSLSQLLFQVLMIQLLMNIELNFGLVAVLYRCM